MTKLSEHRVALINLERTIKALIDINALIDFYSVDKPGPAYARFEYVAGDSVDIQFHRKTILVALKSQKQTLLEYLATLGIDATA